MKRQREEKKKPRKETKISARMPSLPHLPNEIKDKIFLNLSVKTILKFRCVIRDYSRFYNPHFIQMHLNRLIEIDKGSTFIITTASKIYQIDLDWSIASRNSFKCQFPFAPFSSSITLDFDFPTPKCDSQIVVASSCNGLLCLTHKAFYGKIVYLWNPATGVYKQLPAHNLSVDALVLGYDHVSGKFKVLVISDVSDRKNHLYKFEASVYTLGTSSWRSIGELWYSFWKSKWQVFEGCPHWIVDPLTPKALISFSVGDEKFKEIPLPPFDTALSRADLTALGGRLSMFCCYGLALEPKRYELWMRMDDGLENTWIKQLSFNELDLNGYIRIKPWGFKSGHVLLQDECYGPILFNPVTGDVAPLYLRGEPKHFLVFSYIESLAMFTVEDGGDVQQNS